MRAAYIGNIVFGYAVATLGMSYLIWCTLNAGPDNNPLVFFDLFELEGGISAVFGSSLAISTYLFGRASWPHWIIVPIGMPIITHMAYVVISKLVLVA